MELRIESLGKSGGFPDDVYKKLNLKFRGSDSAIYGSLLNETEIMFHIDPKKFNYEFFSDASFDNYIGKVYLLEIRETIIDGVTYQIAEKISNLPRSN